ncbi:MAG: hypothetical protein DRI57_31070 [Deltaproteobacteria bacterium]|nr:MAG: hypothetical protein DRI57_31070 [Deltaproteobacteria bacterium]
MSHTSWPLGSAPSDNAPQTLHTAKLADDVLQFLAGDVVHCFFLSFLLIISFSSAMNCRTILSCPYGTKNGWVSPGNEFLGCFQLPPAGQDV